MNGWISSAGRACLFVAGILVCRTGAYRLAADWRKRRYSAVRKNIGDNLEGDQIGDSKPPAEDRDWSPLRIVRGKLLLSALIEDRPAVGILDTGAEFSVIDERLALEVGLPLNPHDGAIAHGALIQARQTSTARLEIPDQIGANLRMIAVDLKPACDLLGESFEFILGGDVLRDCAIFLDMVSKRFRLGPTGAQPHGHTRLAAQWVRNTPFIRIDIAGQPLRALLDLGMDGDLNITPAAWQKIKFRGARISDSVNGDAGGNLRPVKKVRIPSLRLSGFEEQDIDVRITPSSAHMQIGDADAMIGMGILGRYQILIDCPAESLWLRPSGERSPLQVDRTGLALTPHKGSALRVLFVSQGSPAAAQGWKAGDIICSVDGDVIDATRPEALSWAKGPEGTEIKLVLATGEIRNLVLAEYY